MNCDDELVARQITKLDTQLKDLEAAWGPTHSKLIDKLQALADLYFVLNRYSDAEPLYWRLVQIKLRCYGEHHPDTILGLIDLADAFQAQNKNDEASRYYSCAIRTLIEIANQSGGMTPLLQTASKKLLELKLGSKAEHALRVPIAC